MPTGAIRHTTRPTVRQELDPDYGLEGLTSKQYQFVTASFSGMSDVDAYRRTYDCSHMTPMSVQSAARDLKAHPLVNAKLRQLRERQDSQTSLAPLVTREMILAGITQIATHGDKDSTRLAAYIALGKTVGIDLFRETVVTERRVRTIEEVDAELKSRLKDLAPMIEGESHPVIDQPSSRKRKPRAG